MTFAHAYNEIQKEDNTRTTDGTSEGPQLIAIHRNSKFLLF